MKTVAPGIPAVRTRRWRPPPPPRYNRAPGGPIEMLAHDTYFGGEASAPAPGGCELS